MTGVIATIPRFQFSNAQGHPLAAGMLFTYLAGTTTPAKTYQDQALTIENTNPIRLDARGECVLWLDPAKSYKLVLKSALGVMQWTQDNIVGALASNQERPVETEIQTASAGQKLFTLKKLAYTPGIKSLKVYVDGFRLNGTEYQETASDTVTFNSSLAKGQEVLFETGSGVNSQSEVDAALIPYIPAVGVPMSVAEALTAAFSKLNRVVQVEDAQRNGEPDATKVIQRAIDAVGMAGGGVVELGPGVFDTTGIVVLHSNVTIQGSGRGATILNYIGKNAACISFGQASSGTGPISTVEKGCVRDLSINGNKASGATGAGIRTTQIDGALFENVHVYDTGGTYGFAIVGTSLTPRNDLVVRNCRASRCGADGMDIKAEFARILVDGFVTHDHDPNPAEEGDSVGLDIRGQYVTVMNVWAWGCPEIGIRVRVNAGDFTNNDAYVALANCFAFANKDGFDLSGPAVCGIGAANIHAVRNTRYGMTADGGGHVQVTGSSFSRNLTGIRHQLSTCTLHLSATQINGNSSDGVVSLSTGDFRAANTSIEGNGRYGLNLAAKPSGAVELSNTSIKGNVTGIYGNATTACEVRLTGGQIIGHSSRGIDIIATSTAQVSAIGTRITGNTGANVYAVPAGATFLRCPGYVTRYKGKVSLAVDSTGVKTLTFPHGLARTPAIEDCLVTLARATNVNDYAITFNRVVGASATLVTVQVNVSAASATVGATADVILNADIS